MEGSTDVDEDELCSPDEYEGEDGEHYHGGTSIECTPGTPDQVFSMQTLMAAKVPRFATEIIG